MRVDHVRKASASLGARLLWATAAIKSLLFHNDRRIDNRSATRFVAPVPDEHKIHILHVTGRSDKGQGAFGQHEVVRNSISHVEPLRPLLRSHIHSS